LTHKFSRIKVYNTLALPRLLYRSEIWTSEKNIKNDLHHSRLNFFRRTAKYPLWNRKRNEEILEELKVEPVGEKLRRYKLNWLPHVTRMNRNNTAKIMLNYRPN
jgi:hypothetical protein